MTPEERAAKIVADGQWIAADYYTDESGEEYRQETMNVTLLEREIADAIRAAVAEERERCAKIAEGWQDTAAGQDILEAIRATGTSAGGAA